MFSKISSSVLEAIGHTPLIELSRIAGEVPGKLYAKAEFMNPTGSMKDRIALKMIEDAEKEGKLRPGSVVIEETSGNTGIGLAMVCAIKGYKFIAVMSEGNSPERRQILQAMGARVELVPQVEGGKPGRVTGEDLALVEKRAEALTEEMGALWVNQFHNPSNCVAHYETTAQEIWQQMDGKIDYFLDVVGTSGTFTGIASALKDKDSKIQCWAVEPATAPVLAGKPVTNPQHVLQGSSYAKVPDLWNSQVCDGYLSVTDGEAVRAARRLATEEGLFCGYTAGGNVAAALRLAGWCDPGARIVTILCDSGMKYLSTDLFKV
ncbi:Pyridoxal-5'-phosphate-dependent enzyme, beta subunit [Desulforamulus reducens MI-1]|uniref:cysteine synthase n=1 Tax=Desulforamulus reducens (strain ATCC BAA-1160 / DSM 100696 / MI-1) TaxID=349161 RepID=A4J492_DESRM|nr:cysteine synthase family protein [Desulforamulus reducens]ABO49895.1 Pyridoxal-5'-phosphate-dependent enzyme, beta subunit [Desulforamulus reducens MI-1]